MSKLPFGLKAPSKGTVIFVSIISAITGTAYASKYYADEARKAHCNKVSFLADRPCGVHEMPRKVAVYIMAPPGDSMEKSRNWFREYIKPVLVAGAVDYEIREGASEGSIESSVCEEIKRLRQKQQREREQQALTDASIENDGLAQERQKSNPFAPMMQEVQKKIKEQDQVDGILAIGRLAWREVLSGIAKGCHADLSAPEPSTTEPAADKLIEPTTAIETGDATLPETDLNGSTAAEDLKEPIQEQQQTKEEQLIEPEAFETQKDTFSVPDSLSPVIYIPHENIIGWSNIPYRLYMWICDYKRVEAIGRYAVAAVLKETRPLEVRDVDQGESEKKYWLGDEAKEALEKDTPITLEDRVREALKTYTSSDLP